MGCTMAEVSRKRGLRITVDRALGERLSEGVWRKLDRMMRADGAVREEEAPPVRKLFGKKWVAAHADEFDPDVVSITEAGRQLSAKSKARLIAPSRCRWALHKPAARPQPLGQEAEKPAQRAQAPP